MKCKSNYLALFVEKIIQIVTCSDLWECGCTKYDKIVTISIRAYTTYGVRLLFLRTRLLCYVECFRGRLLSTFFFCYHLKMRTIVRYIANCISVFLINIHYTRKTSKEGRVEKWFLRWDTIFRNFVFQYLLLHWIF